MVVDRLAEDDWAVFRELRLRSLLDSPEAFGSTYGDESSQTERSLARLGGGTVAG